MLKKINQALGKPYVPTTKTLKPGQTGKGGGAKK